MLVLMYVTSSTADVLGGLRLLPLSAVSPFCKRSRPRSATFRMAKASHAGDAPPALLGFLFIDLVVCLLIWFAGTSAPSGSAAARRANEAGPTGRNRSGIRMAPDGALCRRRWSSCTLRGKRPRGGRGTASDNITGPHVLCPQPYTTPHAPCDMHCTVICAGAHGVC